MKSIALGLLIEMLNDAILNNWATDVLGYAQSVEELASTKYPAWTVKIDDSYGVAIPYEGEEEINENFADAKILSTKIKIASGEFKRVILLTTNSVENKVPFATLCGAFADPGENGFSRKQLENSPITWWKEWKELLGNKNIDERIYDVLGELCVLKYVVTKGEEAWWNGPDGATYDIETDSRFIEVKSSTSREKQEVSISSQFQLFPNGKPLNLVFCRFEPTVSSGISIDSVIADFEVFGYNTSLLNQKLEKKGFEKGMSARKKLFILHEMLLYSVDENFPTITPSSFVGGVLPQGVTKITYTADLSGLKAIPLCQEDVHAV